MLDSGPYSEFSQEILSKIANHLIESSEIDSDDYGLLSGQAGVVLFLVSYGQIAKNDIYIEQGLRILMNILHSEKTYKTASLCSGLAGVGWLLDYLYLMGYVDNQDSIDVIDDIILGKLHRYIRNNFWDYLHGYIGIGVYFIRRRNRTNIQEGLNLIIQKIINSSVEVSDGLMWQGLLSLRPIKIGVNISLSHGISGILSFLTKCFIIEKNESIKLIIEKTCKFLLGQKVDKDNSFFPTFSKEDNEIHGSRLGWCYGDLGICYSLYNAGKAINDAAISKQAQQMLMWEAANRRDLIRNGIRDACFCHGTVGVAHIFYRLWLDTHIVEFKYAYEYWFFETLKMSKYDDGIAGYKAYLNKDGNYFNKTDLLNGVSGIGLSLLFMNKFLEPIYDEVFLLS